jgi:hypothetical protein
MMRISSGSTWAYKRVFPVIWFASLAFFVIVNVGMNGRRHVSFVVLPVAMAVAGLFFMKKLVWVLMDEVLDDQDSLVVRKHGDEERIPLSEIVNITTTSGRRSTITLRLRHAGRFGDEVAFLPNSHYTLNPFAKHPVAENLIARVDRARARA